MQKKDFTYPGLYRYFEEFSAVPRPSFHEEQAVAYLAAFARERGLPFYTDEHRNCLIEKAATPGREGEPALLLQGHVDMVCEKNEGVEHDFLREPLSLYEKDGWLRAQGTTLGADDGVAVATMLYILDGGVSSHPPLQCLFTASEEVGLEGAKGFDYSRIHAASLINMDSADESCVIAGCAGGERCDLRVRCQAHPVMGIPVTLRIGGLAGGHSGENIHCGRANANKLLGGILLSLSGDYEFSLVSLRGGSKDNAIPREAVASLIVEEAEGLAPALETLRTRIAGTLSPEDAGFRLEWEIGSGSVAAKAAPRQVTGNIIFLLSTVENGVLAQDFHGAPGAVEFSRNLGVMETNGAGEELIFDFTFSSRSTMEWRLDASARQLEEYGRMIGAECRLYNRYPGWEFQKESPIRERYIRAYRELFGKPVKVEIIHAGLECGIIHEKLPELDILSCGPVVTDLHSPDEALDLASFARFFTVIKRILEGE